MNSTKLADNTIIKKLDLDLYASTLAGFFARAKNLAMEGDINIHFRHIKALSRAQFTPPPQIQKS